MGGELPKQYLEVAGRTLLEHSLRALFACRPITRIIVVLHPHDQRAAALPLLADPRVECARGGAERCDSVLAGLDALAGRAAHNEWVLVHDAARPCVQPADIDSLIRAVVERDTGGILAEPIVDTVKQAGDDGLVTRTLDRSRLWRAQTPQMFRLAELRSALRAAREQDAAVTDEASAMEQAGYPVQLVRGSAGNFKVTVPADLALAGWYLDRAAAGER